MTWTILEGANLRNGLDNPDRLIIIIWFQELMTKTILMTRAKLMAASLIGIGAIFMVMMSPTIASASGGFMTIDKAQIAAKNNKIKELEIKADGHIPTKVGTLIGYGVLTTGGNPALVHATVATSHGGAPFADSALQKGNPNNPVWHNHYVEMRLDLACPVGEAGLQLSVMDLSFTSPGKVNADGKELTMKNLPLGSIATTSVVSGTHTFVTGTAINTAVAFGLSIGPSGQVCVTVTDIATAETED